jgi:hypothetical protein
MKKIIFFLIIVVLGFSLTGCSVYMAATKKGTSNERIQQCRTRNDIISQEGVEILSSTKTEDGGLIEEYKIQLKSQMSGFRAVGHGVADVFTLGLWEAIGTPTEGVLRGQKIIIKVYYDKDEVIKKIERSPSS